MNEERVAVSSGVFYQEGLCLCVCHSSVTSCSPPPSFHLHLITPSGRQRSVGGASSIAMATASLLTPLHPSLQFPWRPRSLHPRAQLPASRRHILFKAHRNDPIDKHVSVHAGKEWAQWASVLLCLDFHLKINRDTFVNPLMPYCWILKRIEYWLLDIMSYRIMMHEALHIAQRSVRHT